MTPEAAFCKAWGRPPTPYERERLRRLQEAFSIEENDALLTIAMVLEFYDGSFRLYPAKCAEATRDAVARWLGSDEGRATMHRAMAALSSGERAPEGVVETAPLLRTVEPRDEQARRELYWVTLGGVAAASSALTGALGMRVGAALAGAQPCWVPRTAGESMVINVLGAPAGWAALMPLLVPAVYAAAWGWGRGRDVTRPWRERCVGWVASATIASVVLAWALVLVRFTLRQ